MFELTKGTTNQIICTVTEKQSIVNPYYLFKFENVITKNVYCCIAFDIASTDEKARYNEFEITEMVSPDLTNGEINLPNKGLYRYTIYQQHSSTNLDPKLAEGVLEIGQAKVLSQPVSVTTFNPESVETTVFNDN